MSYWTTPTSKSRTRERGKGRARRRSRRTLRGAICSATASSSPQIIFSTQQQPIALGADLLKLLLSRSSHLRANRPLSPSPHSTRLAMLLTRPLRSALAGASLLRRNMSNKVNLVTPKELKSLMEGKEKDTVKVLDASWHMPASQRSGFAEFKERRIIGSAFWDA